MTAPTTTDGAMMNTFDLQTCVRNALDPYAIAGRDGSDSAVDAVVSAVLLLSASKPAAPQVAPSNEDAALIERLQLLASGDGVLIKSAFALTTIGRAIQRLAASPAAPAQSLDKTFATLLINAAAKSGNPKAIELAAQLAGASPCAACGFVNYHCRCAAPVQSGEPVAQQSVAYRCPDCAGAGVYAKASVLPEPPDVTCAHCNGRGTLYAAPQSSQPVEAGDHEEACSSCGLTMGQSRLLASLKSAPSAAVLDDERAAQPKQIPQVGETWHIRFPGASALATMEVCELSAGTVVLGAPNSLSSNRYEFHEIAFVERARAASPQATSDTTAKLARDAVRMLEGYAESYESMAKMDSKSGDGTVQCRSVAYDIRANMAGWFGPHLAAQATATQPAWTERALTGGARDINALGEYWHVEREQDEPNESYLSRINARKEEFKAWLKVKYAPARPTSGADHE